MDQYTILLPGDEDAWAQSSTEQRAAVHAARRDGVQPATGEEES